jgi:hypothetical protein
MSVTVLIVEKSGNIKEQNIKFDENELYKKAGHSSQTGFKCYTEWNIEGLNDKSYNIFVYGKTNGRANNENKYEFPPPIDNTLFFGNCVIVNKHNNIPVSITSDEWDDIYEYLYGGFEDLGDEDSEEDADDDNDDEGIPLTKQGYAKDGFIVDDDEVDEDEDYEDDDEEEVCIKKSKLKKTSKKSIIKPKKTSKKSEKPENLFKIVQEQNNYLDCTSELVEEEYI